LTFLKTTLLNAIAVSVKMLTLLALNKVMAMYVGPTGYAALGQFQNAVQMLSTLATGAINTGVTKYTAEYHEDEFKQHIVWQTAGTIALVSSGILSVLILLFRTDLALWIFSDATFAPVFTWFAATLVFLVLNTFLLAIMNGKKDVYRYIAANIAGSVFALLVTSVMVVQAGLMGALVGFAVYQSIAFAMTLALCVRAPWFRISQLWGRMDKVVAMSLAKYAAMALTTAATVPLSHIMIRNHLGQTLSWEAAGYWEAMWRLSGAYLMLVSKTLSVYYLPRLSELSNGIEIRREILLGYRTIFPISLICALVVFAFRNFIVEKLFSSEFLPMEELFFWQLLGDVLKISSWLFAFVMLSRSMTSTYILTEIIFSLMFYLLTVFFVNSYGITGVSVAHFVNYFIYLISMAGIIWVRTK
jgi:PST family polysaccharide transporter